MANIPRVPFTITAMDPGKDTGLSFFLIEPDRYEVKETNVIRYRTGGVDILNQLREWKTASGDMPAIFLYENFHVRTSKKSVNTTAIDVIGCVMSWIHDKHPYDKIVSYEPNQAKTNVQDKVLERLGIKESGGITRHSNDGLRHTVSWLLSQRYVPVAVDAFGPPPKAP